MFDVVFSLASNGGTLGVGFNGGTPHDVRGFFSLHDLGFQFATCSDLA